MGVEADFSKIIKAIFYLLFIKNPKEVIDHPSKIQLGFGDNNQTNQKHSSVPDFRNSLVLALRTISIN